MKTIKAFLKLVRWPNLLMIIVTQLLLQYMVIGHVLRLIQMDLPLSSGLFFLLMASTVFMAAFGYAYNDLKDVEVDEINKDNKRIVDIQIDKKTVLNIARTSLILALLPALYLAYYLRMPQLFLIHIIIAIGLWYYSIDLKKKVLSGNLLISFFTALSIFIIWLYHLVVFRDNPVFMIDARKAIPLLNIIVITYSLFAFVISLIREIIKDVEDIPGDKKYRMQTFAIRYGIKSTKILLHLLSLLMLLLVFASSWFAYSYHWIKLSIYLLVAVGIPLVYLNTNLLKSHSPKDFSDLSMLAKIIMIAGILSMQLFYISYGS